MTRPCLMPTLALLLLGALPLAAQPAADTVQRDMDRLRAENSVLRRELKAIKSIVDGVQAKLEKAKERNPGASLKVGVVDIGRVFKSYRRKEILEEEINQVRKEMKARLALSQKKLRDMGEGPDIDWTKEGTDKARRREALQRDIATITREMKAVLEARVEGMTREILEDIEQAVATLGAARGFDLILKSDPGRSSTAGAADAIFRSQVNAVLFRRDALDLTSEVLAVLNGPRAEWFEDGPLVLVLHALEQAGVSYAGKRTGDRLVIDCRMKALSLAEVARLRETLAGKPTSSHCEKLQIKGGVKVVGPHLEFQLWLEGWSGGGAETFLSLDRLVERDPKGPLASLVMQLESTGLQVQGRSGDQLHLTLSGAALQINAVATGYFGQEELQALGLLAMTTHRISPGKSRLELKFPTPDLPRDARPKKQLGPALVLLPIQEITAKARPGQNVISWSYSSRNRGVVVTSVEVQESLGREWRAIAVLQGGATRYTHRVNDAQERRYRVVAQVRADDKDPRVQELLQKTGERVPKNMRCESDPTDPVKSTPKRAPR